MPTVPYKNPLKVYVDPSTAPEMTVDGITINKSYAYTGTVDALNPQISTFASPQSTQSTSFGQTKLNNKKVKKNLQNFWSSPNDTLGSKDITAIQLKLKIPTTSDLTFFNHLSFDLNDVPLNWSVYYKSPISGVMTQLTDINGNYVGGMLLGSSGYNNGNFGWVHISVDTQVIGTTLLELRLDRQVKINYRPQETNPFSIPQGYPFWLRNVNLKLNATTWDEIPAASVITSRNALGLSEKYIVTQKDSSQIQHPLNRTTGVIDKSSYWKSSPQPVGDAVVNLYTDLGSSQLIDSMYMEPLYSGVQCNLYYSNDLTINDVFYCSRAQSVLTQKSTTSLVTFNDNGPQTYGRLLPTNSGAVFPSTGDAGLLTPDSISLDGKQSWSIGVRYSPNISMPSGSGTSYHTLFEQKNGSNVTTGLYFQNYSSSPGTGTIRVKAIVNGYTLISATTVTKISQDSNGWPWYGFIISYDSSNPQYPIATLQIDNHTNSQTVVTYTGALSNFPYPVQDTPITIGNNVSSTYLPAYGILKDLWIRQDIASPGVINSYFNNPRLFVNANGPATTLRGDYRALLLAPLYSATIRSKPDSSYYEKKTWIPLQSDISVRKATFRIPTILARYIKLEFTNLAPEVYPLTSGSINRTVQLFPDSVINYYSQLQQQLLDSPSQKYYGLQTNVPGGTTTIPNLLSPPTTTGSAQAQFSNPVTLTELNSTQIGTTSEPVTNSTTVIVDPTSNSSLLSSLTGGVNSVQSNSLPPSLPLRFPQTGIHNYKKIQINQTWNQSYFMGLSALNFYKVTQVTQDDTEYYYENCLLSPSSSGSLISPVGNTFSFNNDPTSSNPIGYYTGSTVGNIFTTRVLSSYDKVNSIQLATVSTDWTTTMPIDQVLMQNNSLLVLPNPSYLTLNNIQTPLPQISTFNLTTGVWQFSPPVGSTFTYGVSTAKAPFRSGLDTTNMRCSALARIFLPETNKGTYQLNLYGYLGSSSIPKLLNSTTQKVPLRNWTDLQLVYSATESNITSLYVEVLQIDETVNETFYLTVLAPFYHPIGWSWSLTGTGNWKPITTAINNANAFCSITPTTNAFYIKAQTYDYNVNIKSLLIRPNYPQNPYASQVSIDYFPDPRTNEVGTKVAPVDHPMFKLNSNYYPSNLTLGNTVIYS